MRTVRPLIAGVATSAATLAVLGLTATAQAQPASLTAVTHTYSVPLGVETAVNLTGCASGTTVTSVTPAPPVTAHVVINGNKAKLAGDWLATGATTFTVHCSNATKTTNKLTVLAAPAENAAVGVGSDTIQNVLDQFSADYNATLTGSTATRLYSWDATNPNTGAIGDTIAEKSGCSSIARPDGSSAGITQLATFQKTGDGNFYCSSFARSSRARGSSDPAFAPGGIAFVDLAGDAVTWSAQATTNAPATLTTAQLAAIYNCTDTNWSQVGGKNAPIHAFIPQSSSGTRSFFLGAIGIATPGSCVSDDGGTLEENEGVNPVLKDPDAIFPYSIGKYIAEKFHSTTCNNSACTPDSNGNVCTPAAGKNLFGCNTHGTMVLKQINGVAPTTGTGTGTVINSSFPATFQRTVFEVVPYDPATSDHIPGATSPVGGVNLEAIFGASGFVCTNSTAKADLKNYGFLVTPLCGVTG
jgi:ABC-type phosphate transport system substrate-binding protein